ncbi:hypothetical protein I4U23_024611 [Adineta vaga]|nr:hypothetical protein I4U23_024611 [Adineta vaga]
MQEVVSLIFLVIIQVVSLACTLYILIEFGKKRSQLRSLQNHLIIGLLLVSTWLISFDLVSTQFYYWSGYVPVQTAWACRVYNFSFFSIAGLNRMLMAFLSVERHFLVFRVQGYRTTRTRLLFHYLPLLMIILWEFSYSIVTDLILTCPQMHFRYSYFLCNYTCSILIPQLLLFYIYVQVFCPTIITIIACILLPIRFAMQKRTLQRFQWYQARKMIIQTILICGVYTICWFPYVILLQLVSNNLISLNDLNVSRFLIFAPYITSLLVPFICFYTICTPLKSFIIKQMNRYCFPHREISYIHVSQIKMKLINEMVILFLN